MPIPTEERQQIQELRRQTFQAEAKRAADRMQKEQAAKVTRLKMICYGCLFLLFVLLAIVAFARTHLAHPSPEVHAVNQFGKHPRSRHMLHSVPAGKPMENHA